MIAKTMKGLFWVSILSILILSMAYVVTRPSPKVVINMENINGDDATSAYNDCVTRATLEKKDPKSQVEICKIVQGDKVGRWLIRFIKYTTGSASFTHVITDANPDITIDMLIDLVIKLGYKRFQ